MPSTLNLVGESQVVGLGQMAQPWFQTNHERRTKQNTIFSPVSETNRMCRKSSPVRRVHKLSNHSPAPSGLRNTHIVGLPCRLHHLVKGLGYGPLIRHFPSIFGSRVVQIPQRSQGYWWIAHDRETENGKTAVYDHLCTLFLNSPFFMPFVFVYDSAWSPFRLVQITDMHAVMNLTLQLY